MSASLSSSEQFRHSGNADYSKAKATKRVPDKRRLFWLAIDNYKAGLNAAQGPRDRSYCWKNSAVAHKELGLMEWAEGNKVRAWDHLHSSLDAYSEAWRHGTVWTGAAGDDGVQWSRRFAQQLPADMQAMYSLTLNLETDESLVDNLGRVCDVAGRYDFKNPEYLEVACNIFVDYANRLLRVSVSLDRKLSYGEAYRYIAKMHFPIKEAEKLLKRSDVVDVLNCLEREVSVLREDQRIQEVVFHSRVELEAGKDFLQNLGGQDASQLTDEALLGLDHLRAALNLISEDGIDITLEAEICSHIGNLYLSVFHADSSAEKFFKRCVQLILCHLTGTTEIRCRSEAWYTRAEFGLRTLQERQAKRRDDERRKELETDGTLADIKANYEKGIEHFLDYVYKKYPPGKPPPDSQKPLKKRLTTALSHYHPDKVEDKQDRRKYYTFEEITKYINIQFELTK